MSTSNAGPGAAKGASARLRGGWLAVDLDRLTGEMVAVIEETLQPAHLSLWLRESGGASRMEGAR